MNGVHLSMIGCLTTRVITLALAGFIVVPLVNLSAWQESPRASILTENVAIGFVARDLERFNLRLAELCKEAQIPVRSENLFEYFYHPLTELKLDVEQVVDRHGSGGIVVLGEEFDSFTVRYMYPVEDSNVVAETLGVDIMEFKAGSAYRLPRSVRSDVIVLDGVMSIGRSSQPIYQPKSVRLNKAEPVESPFAGVASIEPRLSEQDQSRFSGADAIVMTGKHLAGILWQDFIRPSFQSRSGSEKIRDRIDELGDDILFSLSSIEMDEGLRVQSRVFLDDSPTARGARDFVRDLSAGERYSNLNHLPDSRFLVAGAVTAASAGHAFFANAVFRFLVERISPGDRLLGYPEKEALCDSFDAIWEQIRHLKVALYRNENGDQGELALVAILDVDDPVEVLNSLEEAVQVANAGMEQYQRAKQNPEIPIRFQANQPSLPGLQSYRQDVLEIDLSRLGDLTRGRLRRFLGEQAGRIRLLPLKNQLVLFIGTNPDLLKSTLENIASNQPGLANHAAILETNGKIAKQRKAEFHFSARNFNYIYSASIRGRKDLGRYARPEEVSSFALVLDDSRPGFDFWIPMKELDRATKLLLALDNFQ